MASVVPAMTGAELQAIREYLGLSTKWLADFLQVSERKVMRWEDGQLQIPDSVTGLVDDLYQEADTIVRWLAAEHRWKVKRQDGEGVVLRTFRTDHHFAEHLRKKGYAMNPYPSRWHRMLCARVMDRVPGVMLDYA